MKIPDDDWIEWRIEREEEATKLTQACFLAPRGLQGFLNWHMRRPLQILTLRKLIKKIALQIEQ